MTTEPDTGTWAALADPHRRAMLGLLRERPRAVGELVDALALSQPSTSKHLRVLREAGLVRARADAQRRVYEIDPAPLAALDAPASGRMAVGEAITNLLAAPFELSRVKLSANWMAACGEPGEDAALYETVKAVGLELCPALGISIPVGKDSLSMRTQWSDAG